MPTDKTIDFVVMFLTIVLLALGLGSMLLGWMMRTWDRFVNRSQVIMSRDAAGDTRMDPGRGRFEPAEPPAVLRDAHQIEPSEPAQFEPVHEPAQLYRLSRQEEIVILAI